MNAPTIESYKTTQFHVELRMDRHIQIYAIRFDGNDLDQHPMTNYQLTQANNHIFDLESIGDGSIGSLVVKTSDGIVGFNFDQIDGELEMVQY